MQLRFHCKKCDLPMRISRWETLKDFHCPRCQEKLEHFVDEKAQKDLEIDHCLLCNSKKLFKQKLFNRNVGIGIVVTGIIISFFVSIPVIPLIVVGLIDAILYVTLPFMLVCYNCDAEMRGFKITPNFDLYDHLDASDAKRLPTYPGARENH